MGLQLMNTALDIELSEAKDRLVVRYTPRTERTIYDLCDMNGRVIKTGRISSEETALDISTLKGARFVMLIVDGDRVFSKRFNK